MISTKIAVMLLAGSMIAFSSDNVENVKNAAELGLTP